MRRSERSQTWFGQRADEHETVTGERAREMSRGNLRFSRVIEQPPRQSDADRDEHLGE